MAERKHRPGAPAQKADEPVAQPAAPAEPPPVSKLARPDSRPYRPLASPLRYVVEFQELAQFVEELEMGLYGVDRGIIRYDIISSPPGITVGLRTMYLVVSAALGDVLVKARLEAGVLWGDDGEFDQETTRRLNNWHAELVAMCGEKSLNLRTGIIVGL